MKINDKDIKIKLNGIIKWLNEFKVQNNCRGVVLGISGGKDSTVVAMLAKKVWGKNVLGVLMPNTVQSDIADSLDIVNTLGIDYKVVNIGGAYDALLGAVVQTTEDGVVNDFNRLSDVSGQAKTNVPPRLRMTVLYSIAQTLGYLVIGTGNASEKYIGWTTKWGDSAFDFNPIGNLTCTEVRAVGAILAREFGLDLKYVLKPPTDGLSGKSDEENFGFSYDVLDSYIAGEEVESSVAERIARMHRASEHKRKLPPTPV